MDNKFRVLENNILCEYEIIATCKNKELGKDYIIYRGNDNNIYAARYRIVSDKLELDSDLTDIEWDFIDKELENYG